MSEDSRIQGVGGIFIKCDNPKDLNTWYKEKLGINTNDYGALFEFRNGRNPEQKDYLQLGTFGNDTKYFEPSTKDYMINFRVDNIDKALEEFKARGVVQVGEVMRESYGNFAHIMDPEGNKIELWEPIQPSFEETAAGETHK